MVDIRLTDITTGTVDGTGVFDKLMSAVKEHINEEYENGRIKGPEYAQVYLGALQGVLSQSIEYVLREKLTEAQAEGLKKEAELKEYELLNIKPKELELLEKDLLLKEKALLLQEEQVKLTYVERVIKDKEAAALGMDKVVGVANAPATTESVYTPKYKAV